MDFQVIPAIDVSRGRLARFTTSGPAPVDAFGGDPLAAAAAFVASGASWLHVVDMDIAFGLAGRNVDVVAALHDEHPSTRIQVSGGLVEPGDLKSYTDAGAERAVLGSAALADREATGLLVDEMGERLVLGVEVDGGRIRARGASAPELPLDETLAWLRELGPARALVTAVERVGELSGPDVDSLARIAPVLGCPVIAAGGVATEGQVRALAELGIEAVVLGTLLYERPEMAGVLLRLAEVLRG